MTLYEIREYTAPPGKLPALIKRFNDDTFTLLEKHKVDVVFAGQTEFGENSLSEMVWVVRWDSYEQMQNTWLAFVTDPEWQRVKADSEHDGPLTALARRRLINSAPFAK